MQSATPPPVLNYSPRSSGSVCNRGTAAAEAEDRGQSDKYRDLINDGYFFSTNSF